MNRMLKYLAITICVLSSVHAGAQTISDPNPGLYGIRYNRLVPDSTLFLPTRCGAPTSAADLHIVVRYQNKSAITYDSCAHKAYIWDPATKVWSVIGSGANASNADSLGHFAPSHYLAVTGGVVSGTITGTTINATSLGGTLTTAAQPNITTVGTLSNLTVSGTIAGGTFSGVLSPGTQNSITAVGILANLTVTGNVNAATLSGVITSVSQPNITMVGTLANLTVTGNISAATISATITKAAQPNITSVGTLSNLTVSGTLSQSVINAILAGNATGGTTAVVIGTGLTYTGNTLSNTSISSGGTVTAITVTGANGINVSGSPITTNGTIALSLAGITPSSVSASGAITGTTLAGTIQTAAQPNITSLGQLGNLSVSGTIQGGTFSGTVTGHSSLDLPLTGGILSATLTGTTINATNLGGTLTTSAQSNVTSLGTLLNLTVTGTVSAGLLSGAGTNINGTAAGLSIGGNAATVTTNANLTGPVTSVGNATTIGSGVVTNAMLAGSIAASKLVGTDITTIGTLVAGAVPYSLLSGTPITWNQNTIGSAATLTNPRNINGVSFNGSADITVTAAAGTLTGGTLASGVTASSLTSLGVLGQLTVTGNIGGANIGVKRFATLDNSSINVIQSTDNAGQNVIKFRALNSSGTKGTFAVGEGYLLASGDFEIIDTASNTGLTIKKSTGNLIMSGSGNFNGSSLTTPFSVKVSNGPQLSVENLGGGSVQIKTDAGTLGFGAPTGQGFEFDINAVSKMSLTASLFSVTPATTFASTLGINGTADNVKSGTYTPTAANIFNTSSFTPSIAKYSQTDKVVTVSGSVSVSATANSDCAFSLTIPVNSSWSTAGCDGVAVSNASSSPVVFIPGAITANSANSVQVNFHTSSGTSYFFSYHYTYYIN